ncbi:MAG: hypothetical protein Kow0081_0500 [Candidatus Dojkabacteria bacterium]
MELLVLIILFWIPPLLVIIRRLFWDLYFWQIKEYRWDRFWTHVRWDSDDLQRDYLTLGIKFLLFSSTTFIFTAPEIAIIGIVLTYTFWVFESFELVKDLLLRKVIRPNLKSVRNILVITIFLIVLLVLIGVISSPFLNLTRDELTDSTLGYFSNTLNTSTENDLLLPDVFILLGFFTLLGLMTDISMPVIIPIFIAITAPLSWIRRQLFIRRGIAHYSKFKNNITFIGITGSQGKTTTKEILYEVLSNKFYVGKTEENMNTKFGLSHSILKNISKKTQIFIGEIGAYRKNEIKNIVTDFSPEIAVITDIDTQHVGLFGTRSDLAKAKSEIIFSDTNVVVLNGDNHYCRTIAKNISDKKIYIFSRDKSNFKELKEIDENPNFIVIYLNKTTSKNNTTTLVVTLGGEKHMFEVKRIEKNYLMDSILISLAVGIELGIDLNELFKVLANIEFKTPRLNIESGDNDTIIINDTYSSSRKGFLAAVELLNEYKKNESQKRIIVTKGIYELGREKARIYNDLAQQTSNQFDYLITTDPLLWRVFNEQKNVHAIKVKNVDEMIYNIRKLSEPNDIILLEGRLNPKIIKELVSDKM